MPTTELTVEAVAAVLHEAGFTRGVVPSGTNRVTVAGFRAYALSGTIRLGYWPLTTMASPDAPTEEENGMHARYAAALAAAGYEADTTSPFVIVVTAGDPAHQLATSKRG